MAFISLFITALDDWYKEVLRILAVEKLTYTVHGDVEGFIKIWPPVLDTMGPPVIMSAWWCVCVRVLCVVVVFFIHFVLHHVCEVVTPAVFVKVVPKKKKKGSDWIKI